MILLDDDEYLKKYYAFTHLKKKMKAITDYYKYHIEIPRVYMIPLSLMCNCNNINFWPNLIIFSKNIIDD